MTRFDSAIVRQRLKMLLDIDDDVLPLARAALLIAQEEYPDLDCRAYERRLSTLAAAVRSRSGGTSTGRDALSAINHQLFEVEQLRGNVDGYYDPRNSFLNDVLDRKLGIPITLSIVYLELCWRTGISAVGIGLPGHFLILVDIGELIYVDPFNRGAKLDLPGCIARFRQVQGSLAPFHPSMLAPISRRQILLVLANLKNIYLRRQDYGRAVGAIDRMLLIDPEANEEYRDRAAACAEIGFFGQTCADYQRYLRVAPRAPDHDAIKRGFAAVVSNRAWSN